jgi:hypothetical protein
MRLSTRWLLLLGGTLALIAFCGRRFLSESFDRLARDRELDVLKLKQTIVEKDQRISTLETLNKVYRDRSIEAELRAEQQYQKYAELRRQIERVPNWPERRTPHPALEADVQGRVSDIDSRSELVTISTGSHNGIRRGQTLEAYRLKPKPEYVGMIRVLDTSLNDSMARAIKPLRAGPIQRGDIVTSRIDMALGR